MTPVKKKQTVFLSVLFLLLFFSHIGVVLSANPPSSSPVPTISIPAIDKYGTLPGLGCGNAYDTSANKCCPMTFLGQSNIQIPATGTLVDVIVNPINSIAHSFIQPVIEGVTNVFGSSLQPCSSGIPSTPNNLKDPSCICLNATNLSNSLGKLCNNVSSGEMGECTACMSGGGVWSAIGCVQADMSSFIQKTILGSAIGIAGGVALLCIMFAAFQMQTSQGNAEKIKKAQQLLTGCITGLMIIIFSVLILKIIGVDILRIPGFNK